MKITTELLEANGAPLLLKEWFTKTFNNTKPEYDEVLKSLLKNNWDSNPWSAWLIENFDPEVKNFKMYPEEVMDSITAVVSREDVKNIIYPEFDSFEFKDMNNINMSKMLFLIAIAYHGPRKKEIVHSWEFTAYADYINSLPGRAPHLLSLYEAKKELVDNLGINFTRCTYEDSQKYYDMKDALVEAKIKNIKEKE